MAERLRIRLVVDPARARIWHRRLAETLRRKGHDVVVVIEHGGPGLPLAISLLLALERLVYGHSSQSAGTEWTSADLARQADTRNPSEPDLIVDLTGRDQTSSTVRTLRPVFAGALLEEAAISGLLSGRVPAIGLLDSTSTGSTPRIFRAAVERPRVLCKSLDNLCARLVTVFLVAIEEIANGNTPSGLAGPSVLGSSQWQRFGVFALLIARARAALTSLSTGAPHWFVGWRRANEDRLSETMHLPQSGWHRLPDDGARFYADPFLCRRDGRTWLFVEEFQYAAGKALISVVELGAEGPIGIPRPIIERPYHLSYPFVFERDGQIWMLPEMSSARRVELLRATQFPDKWEPAGILLDSQEVSDATIIEHNNRLWMFGTVGGGDSSSWDTLHLWHADRLDGEWRPHQRNPVLIDAGSARPAGAFYRRGNEVWRPAQDCTRGYGSGLALARITALDEERYSQEVEAVFYPGGAWDGIGLHTLNWAEGFEVVDGCSSAAKTNRPR
jgi:hypothetical protein